jgi:hypothetical protein
VNHKHHKLLHLAPLVHLVHLPRLGQFPSPKLGREELSIPLGYNEFAEIYNPAPAVPANFAYIPAGQRAPWKSSSITQSSKHYDAECRGGFKHLKGRSPQLRLRRPAWNQARETSSSRAGVSSRPSQLCSCVELRSH